MNRYEPRDARGGRDQQGCCWLLRAGRCQLSRRSSVAIAAEIPGKGEQRWFSAVLSSSQVEGDPSIPHSNLKSKVNPVPEDLSPPARLRPGAHDLTVSQQVTTHTIRARGCRSHLLAPTMCSDSGTILASSAILRHCQSFGT